MIGINEKNIGNEENYKIKNFTINGKCSNCGECCSNFLPISTKEAKNIMRYMTKHDIKEQKSFAPISGHFTDGTCPFRDSINKKCLIYDVRPEICRLFLCSGDEGKNINIKNLYYKKYGMVDIRETFFGKDK